MIKNSNKHWLVLICCCGLAAASIGISINSSGIFYTPVSDDLHILRGSFSMHMTVFSLTTAFASLLIPKLMEKFNYKLILIVSVIVATISTAAMSLGTTALYFDILGFIRGFSTCMFSLVPITMIINNWFIKKHGLATSIALGFSGLAGSICSPIMSNIITDLGWQTGYIIKALIILGLCLPAIIYPFHLNPRDDNLLPYGYEKNDISETNVNTLNNTTSIISLSFICFFIFALMISCITSITQHLPGYADSIGYSASIGATLLSAGMIGNIVSKIIIGMLSDHLGVIKATIIMMLANCLGVVLLLISGSSIVLILGAFLFGSCYCLGAVGVPLLTKYFFGDENYPKYFPKFALGSNLGAAISFSAVGFIYDITKSYSFSLIFALIMLGICGLLLLICYKQKRA
ncbi:MAG: MFS transporter [Thomasclavelia sp.]|nr:MFS transporter [Thomasclavelia sp.]